MASKKQRKKNTRKKSKVTRVAKSPIYKRYWLYLVIIAVITGVFMSPVIQADFTELDDQRLILEKVPSYLKKPVKAWQLSLFTPHYKPIVNSSWAIEGAIFGLDAKAFHINNLLLHILNSLLAFFLVFRLAKKFDLTKRQPELVALGTALLFGVHPMHVESVAWAIERKDVLYTLFFFLGLLSYLNWLKVPKMQWMLLTAGCFLLSVLSKAPAIVLPFILLLIDYAYRRKLNVKRLVEKWPVFIVFLVALILFGVFGGGSGGHAGSGPGGEGNLANIVAARKVSNVYPVSEMPGLYAKWVLLGLKGVGWYLHTLIPVRLSLAYPYREWLPAIGQLIHVFPLLLAAAAVFVFRARKKYPFLFFTHAFFFMAMGPALIRTGLGKGIFLSDRYVYLACLGILAFIVGWAFEWMRKKKIAKRTQLIGLGVVVAAFGLMTFFQSRTWDNGETLWSNTIDKYPSIAYAYVNRGIYRNDLGQTENALQDFNKAVELGDDPHAYIHRGTILRKQGQTQAALADFNTLLAQTPNDEHAINGKANVLFQMGRYQEAEQTYSDGLALKPGMITFYVNRAAARYYLGKYTEALADLAIAERRNPGYGSIYSKKTVICMAMGDYENAVISARKTAQFEPQNHANLGDLGTALQKLGRHQEAVDAFTQALQLFDRGKRYYNGRARSYQALGNKAAAKRDRDTAKSL